MKRGGSEAKGVQWRNLHVTREKQTSKWHLAVNPSNSLSRGTVLLLPKLTQKKKNSYFLSLHIFFPNCPRSFKIFRLNYEFFLLYNIRSYPGLFHYPWTNILICRSIQYWNQTCRGYFVSRVGSAGQIKAMKQVESNLVELEAQFASDLDKPTQDQLARGQRLLELLKQSQSAPLTVEEQIMTIYTGTNCYLDPLEIEQVRKFLIELRSYVKTNKPQFQEIISSTKTFTPEPEALLKEAIQ